MTLRFERITSMGSTMLKLCTMVHLSNHRHISNIMLQIHDLSNFLSSKLHLQNVKNTDAQCLIYWYSFIQAATTTTQTIWRYFQYITENNGNIKVATSRPSNLTEQRSYIHHSTLHKPTISQYSCNHSHYTITKISCVLEHRFTIQKIP